MYAIDILGAEHENVRRLNRVMRAACLGILRGQPVDIADFRSFIRMIREYADHHHHGKEEQLLFREMEMRLGPAVEKLVRGGMLVEHDLGRLYVKQLEEALNRQQRSPAEDNLLDILANAVSDTDLLERHIEKENMVGYRFAEQNLPDEVWAVLNEQTRAFETSAQSRIRFSDAAFCVQVCETVG